MKLVIMESPFAGDVQANIKYARQAISDSLHRGEAPIASHLLYTQEGILDDLIPEERKLGITAGLEWRRVCEKQVFYTDRGWSSGMLAALHQCLMEVRPFALRALHGEPRIPATLCEEEEEIIRKHIEK